MKILLVDNHTDHLYNFNDIFLKHDVEIQEYKPGLVFHDAGKDLVILSGGGGEGFELKDKTKTGKLWYDDEMNFVLSSDKPILGICMGFEIIAAAYGSHVKHIGRLIQGFKTQTASLHGKKQLKLDKLSQFEHHRFAIGEVSAKHFEVLADSPTGLEMIKHKTRRITATQFHPEQAGGTLRLDRVLHLV